MKMSSNSKARSQGEKNPEIKQGLHVSHSHYLGVENIKQWEKGDQSEFLKSEKNITTFVLFSFINSVG